MNQIYLQQVNCCTKKQHYIFKIIKSINTFHYQRFKGYFENYLCSMNNLTKQNQKKLLHTNYANKIILIDVSIKRMSFLKQKF